MSAVYDGLRGTTGRASQQPSPRYGPKIFGHPASANIEWRQVLSLLEAIGTVTAKHDGKLEVTVGPETEVLRAPQGKDVDLQMVVDLRRMLEQAGFAPGGGPAIPDQRSRDHGDGQWGVPTQ